ncbi:prophage tail fiber N-terminal domain and S74 family endopeptidase-containing protein [Escherichia coli]|uniref:prophage tail fiber N-terminal domain and S74 family endopeptidase-containing protein n=5 Tax=Escherichia TaxID=561 RepID=UPI0034C5B8DD
MAVKISGVLKDGAGKPIQNCTIQLKARRNSTTVVVNTVASENPDEAGRYTMDVEYGQYSVSLLVEGFPPSHAGIITVYEDSKPGTLNDFLGAMTEDDARPEALRRFELMVEEVARNASAVEQNTAAAKKSASDASTSAREAATRATDAAGSARAASTSAGQAASSAQSASSSAGTASTKATEASKSAAAAESSKSAAATSAGAAKTSEMNAAASQKSAATSASTATTKASEAATSARDAAASKEAAKSSETSAASSASNAASSATAAGNSAKAAKTSETNADNSAQAAADSQTASANSATAAKKSETNAKNSEAAAKSSETNAKASETNAKSSETNAAKSAADALNYRNQAQGIVGNNIGLGASPRDCPDISGNPSGYIGFMRIMASAKGFPSIASGESSLTGFISQVDGSPAYTGIFQGWASRSLYTYRWSTGTGPQWTRHARKDEVSRFSHSTSERTVIFSSDGKSTGCYLQLDAGGRWGYYSPVDQNWKPLAIEQGGTGARDAATARTNLGVGTGNDPQFRNLKLFRITDVTTGWVAGGQLTSKLLSTSGDQRVEGIFYAETNVSSPSQATIKISTPSEGTKYFSFNTKGQILAEAAIFRANYSNPLIITSAHPTISFQESDRPEGSPAYAFVFDGGNWRIQKEGTGYSGEYIISYEYANNRIVIPSLRVSDISAPGESIQKIKNNLLIPNTGLSRWYDYAAPAGAEADKYYPIIISHPSGWNGDAFVEVSMRTRSLSGSYEPNCNMIHLWMRDGGWSDMGQGVFGHYHCYARNEVAILCVRGTDKGWYPHNAIYVRGDAFPIRLAATVGCSVTIPTADWKPSTAGDSPTYKWGITNSSDGIDLDTYGISGNLLDFTSGATGFYCTDAYRNKYGYSYQVIQENGTIQPANGVLTYSDQDWNAQQSDNVGKFKPIAGNINTPENSLTYGGFHVGFNGTHATQFAGRNSKFFARSFEAGVDKGWCQLATLNASSQRWTGYQQFKSTEFFADTYTRKVSLAVANSAVRNGELYLWGAESRPTVFEYKIKDPDTNASLKWVFYAQQNTDDSCQFQVNGAVNCVTVNQSSDRDLKDNIQVIGDATEAIRKMNGYTYTLKENGLPYAGVIAQEVMEALPEAVGSFTHYGEALQGPTIDGNELREETRYLNVDYAAVTGLLVQVARETDGRVTALEEENITLRKNLATAGTRISTLENQVSELVALVRQLTGSEH